MLKKIIFALVILTLLTGIVAANELDNATFDDLANDINATAEHDTVYLEKDYQSTNTSKQIIIEKSITVDGKNHIISAPDVDRVFLVKADNVIIKNINFINANKAGLAGGVISWLGDNGSLINCSFTNNSAKSGGGAVVWRGDNAIVENCSFKNNSVYYGPAISLTSGESYNSHMIHIQIVEAHGGALYFDGDNLLINGCDFLNNNADLAGGAISTNWGSNIKINNSRFKNNKNSYSGAIDLNADNVTISNSVFLNNSPTDLFNNCKNTVLINTTFTNSSSIDSWYDYQNIGYFDELSKLISETPEGGLLVLNKDYQYITGSNKGILISKSITIDGNGHTLDGIKLSRMFNITSDNVVIKNINFINGNAFGRYFAKYVGGGAIYWSGANGLIENCNFTNNSGSGIEDDPFDKEETVVGEDGMIIHIIRVRPMGAKLNEGGAIVWNGTNGTVSNCLFINNNVGYPNTGGAICWRGDNGKIINSEFYENSAWCGAAIAWIGDNGTIMFTKIIDNGFFDGGIYWFGDNGTISYSILLGSNSMTVFRPTNANINADYNFWGDTIENPDKVTKIEGITKWFVLSNPLNEEFLINGTEVLINNDIYTLFKNAVVVPFQSPINCSSEITCDSNSNFINTTLAYEKVVISDLYLDIKAENKVSIENNLITKNLFVKAKKSVKFKIKLLNAHANQLIKITFKGKTYKLKTNKKGIATFKVPKKLKVGKYKIKTTYNGLTNVNKIIVKK